MEEQFAIDNNSDSINPFELAFFIFAVPFWWGSLYGFNRISSRFDIAKNANHFLHALLFVGLYRLETLISINYLILLSIGFYTYDFFYILYCMALLKEAPLKHLPFAVHHIIGIYGLYLAYFEYFREPIIYLYYLLEFSNFMLYTSYYVSKKWPEYKNLQLVSFSFQFIWYSYFRIVRYCVYMYTIWDLFLTTGIYIQLANGLLFLMGLYWSFNLFKKCLKDLRIIDVTIKKKLE